MGSYLTGLMLLLFVGERLQNRNRVWFGKVFEIAPSDPRKAVASKVERKLRDLAKEVATAEGEYLYFEECHGLVSKTDLREKLKNYLARLSEFEAAQVLAWTEGFRHNDNWRVHVGRRDLNRNLGRKRILFAD